MFDVEAYRVSDGRLLDVEHAYSFWQGPIGKLRSVPWKKTLEEYSESDWAVIEAATRKRIDDGLAIAVPDLDF